MNDGYFGSGIVLKHAVKKYGQENLQFRYMEFVLTNEALNEREIFWIHFFKNHETRDFYNLADGGRGGDLISKHLRNSELRRQTSIRHKGKIVSEETRKKMSANRKGQCTGSKNYFWGGVSKEIRDKSKRTRAEYFKTHSAWNKGEVGVRHRTTESINNSILNNANVRPIIQFTLEGKFVNRYDFNPKTYHTILGSCQGRVRQSGGYIWLYEDEYLTDNSVLSKRIESFNVKLELLTVHIVDLKVQVR